MNEPKQLINRRILIGSFLLIALNVLLVNNIELIGAISFLEFFVLLFLLLLKGVRPFLIALLIFTSTSFDVAAFVDTPSDFLYSITRLPVLGFLGFFLLMLMAIFIFFTKEFTKTAVPNEGILMILRFSMYTIVAGITMSLICFLTNDNNISQDVFMSFFQNDFASYTGICFVIILFGLAINNDNSFLYELKQSLFSILVALIIGALFSVLVGAKGIYGKSDIILMPLTFFFSTSIVLFIFDSNYKQYRYLIIILSLISIGLQVTFSNALGGKSWVVFFFVCAFLFLRLYRKGHKTIVIFTIVFFLGTVGIFFSNFDLNNTAVDESGEDGNLMERKINEALSLFLFTNTNYLENLPDSPKARFDEFTNIIEEYKEKPFMCLFGKGFGGSIKDHKSLFGNFQSSAFSDVEYINNSFVYLHESINVVLLKLGIIGLFLFICVLYNLFKIGINNAWSIIGLLWMFFFFGYTYSLGVFGVVALIIGLFEARKNEFSHSS